MTYFAFDTPLPLVAAETVEEIVRLKNTHNGMPLHVFAMIDGAFDESFFEQTFRSTSPRISLYENSVLNSFGSAVPFLACAPEGSGELSEWVARLAMACGNRPMWSLIVSAIPSAAFVRYFSRFLIAQCEDLLEWPIRWGDSRVLPELLTKLPSKYTRDVFEPIYVWFVCARQGGMLRWTGAGQCPVEPFENAKLLLDDRTFAGLVEASEPDAVIAQIDQTEPALLRHRKPSECHRLVSRYLEVADKFGIEAAGARRHFASLGLYLYEDFWKHREFQRALTNMKGGHDYFAAVKELPECFWNDVQA